VIITSAFLQRADTRRIGRAHGLTAQPVAPFQRQYRITGGDEPHFVDLSSADVPGCDCPDYLWRGEDNQPCKHILAALLFEGGKLNAVCRECGCVIAADEPAHRTFDGRSVFCDSCAGVCTSGVR
jgi:hypothetical protein